MSQPHREYSHPKTYCVAAVHTSYHYSNTFTLGPVPSRIATRFPHETIYISHLSFINQYGHYTVTLGMREANLLMFCRNSYSPSDFTVAQAVCSQTI